MPGNINFSKFWAFVGRLVPPLVLCLYLFFFSCCYFVIGVPLHCDSQPPVNQPITFCNHVSVFYISALYFSFVLQYFSICRVGILSLVFNMLRILPL